MGHGSFASSHPGRALFEVIDLHRLPQRLWPDHCVQGTEGACFRADLDVARFDLVVHKGADPRVDSYSAFADNGGNQPTALGAYLTGFAARRGVTPRDIAIDVVGLALDCCVKASALDAAHLDLRTRVLIDATRAVDPNPAVSAELVFPTAVPVYRPAQTI